MQVAATKSATLPRRERPGDKESCVVVVAHAGIFFAEDARVRHDDAGVVGLLR